MSATLLHWLLPRSAVGRWLLGMLLLLVSTFLTMLHSEAVESVKVRGLPAALRITPLEERRASLEEQVALMDIQMTLRSGSLNERIRTTALPDALSAERITRLLELFAEEFGVHPLTEVHISDPVHLPLPADTIFPVHESLWMADANFDLAIDNRRWHDAMLLLELSGVITIGDSLSESERETLLALGEKEGPGAVLALEQFLLTDLLTYSRNPSVTESALLRAVSSDGFEDAFFQTIATTTLPAFQHLLAGRLGEQLEAEKLWPIRLFTVESLDVTDTGNGLQTMNLTLRLFFRHVKKV